MAKLTLSVDDNVIARAKRYAKAQNVSISQMVETYLAAVTHPKSMDATPALRALRGSLSKATIQDHHRYLEKKYL